MVAIELVHAAVRSQVPDVVERPEPAFAKADRGLGSNTWQ